MPLPLIGSWQELALVGLVFHVLCIVFEPLVKLSACYLFLAIVYNLFRDCITHLTPQEE